MSMPQVKKIIPIILIIFCCVLVWYKTLNQSFLGEGFFYFDRGQDFFSGFRIIDIWEYDNFAKITFDVLPPIFGYNIQLYQCFQLLVMVVLALVLYKFIKYFTHNSWISVTGTIIFSTSYLGLFEMIGVSQYDRFVQRIPNQIFLLLSFIQLAKYFDLKRIKNYIFSLILFAIAVFLAHFSTFWLPLFVLYPLVFSLCHRKTIISTIKNLAFLMPFILINLYLISRDVHTPGENFQNFISNYGVSNLITQEILQISNMTLPPFLIEKIASISSSYVNILLILTLPILTLIISGIFLIAKKQKAYLPIYLLSVISLPILIFLDIFLGKVNAIYNMRGYTYFFLPKVYSINPALTASLKGDRYYMIPYFFLAIIFAILIYVLIKNKLLYKIATIVFLTSYVLYNLFLVTTNMAKIQSVSEDMKKYLAYIKTISTQLNDTSIVIVPREFMWPSSMIRSEYGYPNIVFLPNDTNWQQQINPNNYKNVLQIGFYYDVSNNGTVNSQNNHIIPLHITP